MCEGQRLMFNVILVTITSFLETEPRYSWVQGDWPANPGVTHMCCIWDLVGCGGRAGWDWVLFLFLLFCLLVFSAFAFALYG